MVTQRPGRNPSTTGIARPLDEHDRGRRGLRGSPLWIAAGFAGLALALTWRFVFDGGLGAPKPTDEAHAAPPRPILPAPRFTYPRDGEHLNERRIEVAGDALGRHHVLVNGEAVIVDAEGRFRTTFSLPPDARSSIAIADPESPETELGRISVVVDERPPTIECRPKGPAFSVAAGRFFAANARVVLEGRVIDVAPGVLDTDKGLLGSDLLEITGDGSFEHEMELVADGDYPIEITAVDRAGNLGRWSGTLVVDTRVPELALYGERSVRTKATSATVRGRVVDAHPARLTIERAGAATLAVDLTDGSEEFEAPVDLAVGANHLSIGAADAAGNRSGTVRITIERERPQVCVLETTPTGGWSGPPEQARVTLSGTADQSLTRLTVNGAEAIVDGREFHVDLALSVGTNTVEILPYDEHGIPGTPHTVALTREEPRVPPGCSAAAESPIDGDGRATRIVHDRSRIELVLVPARTAAATTSSGTESPSTSSIPATAGGPDELRRFYLGVTELTRAQYERIAGYAPIETDPSVTGEHPVVDVSFADARAFCERAGLRLPTETEWEYAGRGASGVQYPWGDEWDASASRARAASTAAVGTHPRDQSWCGVLDLAGNVSEWCTKAAEGGEPALRGGSWSADAESCKLSKPKRPLLPGASFIGFRVCLELAP